MKRLFTVLALTAAIASPLAAQGKGKGRDRGPDKVPPGHYPPPGMCRIWLDGVPPGQQPAPTDCATAIRNRPANARVIFGDDAPNRKGRGDYDRDDVRERRDRDDDRVRGDRDRDVRDREDDGDWRDRVRREGTRDDGRSTEDDDWRVRVRRGQSQLDGASGYPSTLPEMASAIVIGRGRSAPELRSWLGGESLRPRWVDADRNGRPERVTWLNGAGQVVQVWVDANRDGRADRVELYRDGRRVRVID